MKSPNLQVEGGPWVWSFHPTAKGVPLQDTSSNSCNEPISRLNWRTVVGRNRGEKNILRNHEDSRSLVTKRSYMYIYIHTWYMEVPCWAGSLDAIVVGSISCNDFWSPCFFSLYVTLYPPRKIEKWRSHAKCIIFYTSTLHTYVQTSSKMVGISIIAI